MSNAIIEEMLAENRWRRYREQDRYVQIDGETEIDLKVVVRVIPDVPRESLDAMKSHLATVATVTNPLVDGRPLAGEWQMGFVEVRWERLDNQQVNTCNLYQTLWQAGSSSQDYVVTERSCRYKVEIKVIFSGSEFPDIPVPVDEAGVVYRLIGRNRDDQTGVYEFVIEKRTRLFQTTGTYTSAQNDALSETTTERTGITNQGTTTITEETGKSKSKRLSVNEDCSRDETVQVRTAKPQDTGWIEYQDLYGITKYRAFRNQTKQWVESLAGSLGTGTQNAVSAQPNEFGLYDGTATVSPTGSGGGGSADGNGDLENYTYDIEFEDGKVYRVSVRYTIFLSRAQEHLTSFGQMAVREGLPTPGITKAGSNKWRSIAVVEIATASP